MSFNIIHNDIAQVEADAIVNSANPYPICGGSTEAHIYEVAGHDELLEARQKIGYLNVCEAKHTKAFNLKAKYIVHVSAPKWNDGRSGEETALKICYRNALEEAYKLGCQSIAFPLLSTGVYQFPKPVALPIANRAIKEFLQAGADEGMPDRSTMRVDLVLYDKDSTLVAKRLMNAVNAFIEENYEPDGPGITRARRFSDSSINSSDGSDEIFELDFANRNSEPRPFFEKEPRKRNRIDENDFSFRMCECKAPIEESPSTSILDKETLKTTKLNPTLLQSSEDIKKGLDDMFKGSEYGKTLSDRLIEIIHEKSLTPSQVQHFADIDRKLYSKILNKEYKTTKPTVIALAIGLQLNYQEAKDFLALAGFALSPASKADLIVRFFMENKEYFYKKNFDTNRYKVTYLNDFLMLYGLDTLGASRHIKPLPVK